MSPSIAITTVTECIPNVWQPTTTSKKQILDYRENSGDNNNNSSIQEQRPFVMNSEEKKSINSTTVESLAVTENHHEESTTAGRMMQSNSQQKRISKRVHRSSDHYKRAAISNQNRKPHANNINKANNNATLPTITNNTDNEILSSLPSTTITITKNSGKQEEEVEDRVVRSDEIALFMRCKKRYSDPDFKPIPPLPGGWDEVTPDRVISWEQTAEMLNDFSSYKQNDPDWKNKLPWVRHHRHHHHHVKDTNKKSTSSSGITDNVVTVSNKDNNVKATADANKAIINNSNNTRYHDKNDVLSNSIKSITRQNDVPWTPVPGQIDYHGYHYKQQHHSLSPPTQPSYRTISNPPIITSSITNDSFKIQGDQNKKISFHSHKPLFFYFIFV
ncbi:hypothetical protein BDC45DRAFT_123854 [Circinella umbellata]|nr:hypothetical protein BDC45DRAFT_123854 [Circinella umbellata]